MKTSNTMQIHFTALAIASLLAVCAGQQIPAEILSAAALAPRGPVPRVSLRALRGGAELCQGRLRSCTSCRRYAECAFLGGELELLNTAACPDSAPFCDPKQGGLCVARHPAHGCELPVQAEDFTCYAGEHNQGYFPAPQDCGKYYVCAPGRKAYVYVCPAGLSYDHSAAGCTSTSTCSGTPLDCASSARSYVQYDQDPSVYAYCTDSNTALVSKCFPGYTIDVNNPTRGCLPHCSSSAAGRFRNIQDPRGYFECFGQGKPTEQWCPTGMEFDDLTKRCATRDPVIPSTTQPAPVTSPTNTTDPPANPTTAAPVSPTAGPNVETTAQPVYRTTAQPVYRTTAQPVYRTTAQPVYRTTAQPVYRTTAQPVYRTTDQSVYRTTAQPFYGTTAQNLETTVAPANPTTAPEVQTLSPPSNTTTAPDVQTTPPPANRTTAPNLETTFQPLTAAFPINPTTSAVVNNP